jgi:hypothetical protein
LYDKYSETTGGKFYVYRKQSGIHAVEAIPKKDILE